MPAMVLGVEEDTLSHLQPHQIAVLILRAFHKAGGKPIARGNLTNRYTYMDSNRAKDPERVVSLLMEGFHWLDRNDYVMPCPGNERPGEYVLTRRGIEAALDLETVPAAAYPMALLHERIADAGYSLFVQGKFDLAILAAFRELEILVRTIAALPATLLGKALMEEAFRPGGNLAMPRPHPEEQKAEMALFAATVGYYRNPSGHRDVVEDPAHAFEVLIIASHLYRIAENRPTTQASAAVASASP